MKRRDFFSLMAGGVALPFVDLKLARGVEDPWQGGWVEDTNVFYTRDPNGHFRLRNHSWTETALINIDHDAPHWPFMSYELPPQYNQSISYVPSSYRISAVMVCDHLFGHADVCVQCGMTREEAEEARW